MRRFLATAALVLALVPPASSVAARRQQQAQAYAQQTWDRVIAAKGGRPRLHAVSSLLETYGSKHKGVSLYVFPDRRWQWLDDRPSKIGLAATMTDVGSGVSYLVYPDELPRDLKAAGVDDALYDIRQKQEAYLLETKWIMPVPVDAAPAVIGGKRVILVNTLVGNERVNYGIDPDTYMVYSMTVFQADEGRNPTHAPKEAALTRRFDDYTSIQGVMMPRRVNLSLEFAPDEWVRPYLELNVGYDDTIFTRPPSLAAGPEAWRLRRDGNR